MLGQTAFLCSVEPSAALAIIRENIAMIKSGSNSCCNAERHSDAVGPFLLDRLAPEMREVIEELKRLGARPLAQISVEEARTQPGPIDAAKSLEIKRGVDWTAERKISTEDVFILSTSGRVRVRVYKPSQADGLYPAIIYFHSGGFVIGDIDAYDQTARRLALYAHAIVVSVDYHKAPEYPFPAAHEDAWAAYLWARDQLEAFGGDVNRIAVVGESAGGNLAANVAIRAIAENVEPPTMQLLIYPLAGNDLNTVSYRENADSLPLGKSGMVWFFRHAFLEATDAGDPRINLVARTDLKNLPPATIITAELDPLRTEGQLLADHLRAAGVAVNALNVKGVGHEFFGMNKIVPAAKHAMEVGIADLRRVFVE